MHFSLQLFGLPAAHYAPLAVRAEALGLEAVWLADHVVTPLEYAKRYPYTATGDPGYLPETPLMDVAVTLGCLAAHTTRLRLGSGVLVLPLRNPFHVARSWAALQELSGGRAVLGIGTGWMEEEFVAIGEAFHGRGRRTDEMLDVIAALWSGQPVAHDGPEYPFPRVQFAGAPTTPVPLVFGGHAPPALARAARRGDGWFAPNVPLERTRELTGRLDQFRVEAGRGDLPFVHYVRLPAGATSDDARRYADAGYDHAVLSPFRQLPAGAQLSHRLDALSRAADALSGKDS